MGGRAAGADPGRSRRRWGYCRRGCSPADGADLSLLIIGCARGKGGGAGTRTSGGPASSGRRRKCVGPAADAAQMRPRGPRPTRRWRRVLQGPSRMPGLALASVLEKG